MRSLASVQATVEENNVWVCLYSVAFGVGVGIGDGIGVLVLMLIVDC